MKGHGDFKNFAHTVFFALLVRLAEEQIVESGEEIVVQPNKEMKGTAMANPMIPKSIRNYNNNTNKRRK
ncbi:MAG: hypothetical protein EOM37_12875 [Proteobacteria bacterium]|nr:hypothetical protein [Pseudomonadota bacterium]